MRLNEETQNILNKCIALIEEQRFLSHLNTTDSITSGDYAALSTGLKSLLSKTENELLHRKQHATALLEMCEIANSKACQRLANISSIQNTHDRKNIYLIFYKMYKMIFQTKTNAAKSIIANLQPAFVIANNFFNLQERQDLLLKQMNINKSLLLKLRTGKQSLNSFHYQAFLKDQNIKLKISWCRNETCLSRLAALLLVPCVNTYRFINETNLTSSKNTLPKSMSQLKSHL